MADLQLDRPHIWKYMSEDERQRILKEEAEAKAELQARKEAKEKEDTAWHEQSSAIARAAALVEREKELLQKEKERSMAQQNSTKANEDRQRQYHLNHVVYTNKPSQDYFSQFNTSSR